MQFPKKDSNITLTLSSGEKITGHVLFWAHEDNKDVTWTCIINDRGNQCMYQQFWIAGFIINFIKPELFDDIYEPEENALENYVKNIVEPEPPHVTETDMTSRAKKFIQIRSDSKKKVIKEMSELLNRDDIIHTKHSSEIYQHPFMKK